MPSIDMPLDQLRNYKPALYREPDFDAYWQSTLAEARQQPLNPTFRPYALPTKNIELYELSFDGYHGGRITGHFAKPAGRGPFPGLCVYHGYSGRGPRPYDLITHASQGIAVLTMDCRGQNNESQDLAPYTGGHFQGWMTRGIRDPQTYYYRYVYADAVRALELLASRDDVDEKRLAITGISQGGGLTLAVAALSDRPILAMPDVPFLCDYRRAIDITPAGPYPEIPNFLKQFPHLRDQTLKTLSYVDNLNLAPRIKCRTVISNCLWDDVCPPSTIFAVYNHITAEKHMDVYPYHKHEVPYEQHEKRHRLLMETLKP
jgi:cephalosporin-C deacetylase